MRSRPTRSTRTKSRSVQMRTLASASRPSRASGCPATPSGATTQGDAQPRLRIHVCRPRTLHNGVLVLKRASVGFLASLVLLATTSAGAGWLHSQVSGATARAFAIRVVVPDQAGASTPTVSAPDDAVVFSGGFDYNGVVKTGSANASVSAVSQPSASASASAEVSDLNVFAGEITASNVVAQAHANARAGAANGDINGSAVTGLVALGQAVSSGTGSSVRGAGAPTAETEGPARAEGASAGAGTRVPPGPSTAGDHPEAHRRWLRVPGLRAVVFHRYLRRAPR